MAAITVIYLYRSFTCIATGVFFLIEPVGFSSGNKTKKRLVVLIEILCWSFSLDVLAAFFRYSSQSSGTAFADLLGLPVFRDLEVVVWKSRSNKMFIIRFLFWNSSFKKLVCFSRRSILLLSLFSVRPWIWLRVNFSFPILRP